VIRALTAQLAELAERPDLHCLVLRGSGTRASWLLLTGENIGALQAERWGLLNECVPGDQLDARIAQIAEGLGGIGIAALRQQKRLLRRWEGMGVDSAITDSVAEFGAAFNTGEPQHHMNAFLERKQAKG
jgi:enoyl-CoA hydratase/carnithine racemase